MSPVKQVREPRANYLALEAPALLRGFELLATAEGGVAKLRELILSLAVQGKLVCRDHSDEPANFLLKKIAKRAGRTHTSTPTDQLPEGWAATTFGEYALALCTGPFGSLIAKDEYIEGGIPLVNPSHMKNGRIEAQAGISVSTAKANELKAYALQSGDIVFARRGDVGRTAVVSDKEDGWLCGTGSFFARFHPDVDRAFVQLVFNSAVMRSYLGAAAIGTTMVNLNQRVLLNAPLDIPPLAEQHRIVARVEELMTLCDELGARGRLADEQHTRLTTTLFDALTASDSAQTLADNWQRIATHFDLLLDRPQAIDALEQTILQLAVRGLLVPQDADDEPASKLLARIRTEKDRLIAEGKIKRDKPQPPVRKDETPFEIPKSWRWVHLADICSVVTDGEHLTPQRVADSNAVPLVTAKNVRDEYMDYAVTDFVPVEVAEKCWARCRPEARDVLMVSVGATLGRLAILRDPVDMVLVRSVTVLRPIQPAVSSDFLAWHLRSPSTQSEIWRSVKQSAQPCLYLAKSNALLIAVPPLAEQHRIVARVEHLRRLCDDLRERLNKVRATQTRLAEALVTEAVQPQRDVRLG